METPTTSQTRTQEPTLLQKTLNMAGFGYVLGDIAMISASAARVPKNLRMKQIQTEAQSGAVWLAGGLGATIFGNPDIDTQLRIQSHKLENHLKQHGALLDGQAREGSPLLQERGPLGLLRDFCYEHPSEILNTGYAVGAALLLHDGAKNIFQKKTHTLLPKMPDFKNATSFSQGVRAVNHAMEHVGVSFWMGALVLGGALIGLFAKEDPKAKEHAENGNVLDKTVSFVREKPLRIAAGCYMANNAFLALRFGQDFHLRQLPRAQGGYAGQKLQPHVFSGAQLGLYIMSNLMLMASSRDQMTKAGFDDAAQAQLEDAAARMVAAQPPAVQAEMLRETSEYMAKQKGVTLDAQTIADHLAARISSLTQERLGMPAQAVASR